MNTCTQQESIVVSNPICDNTVDWQNNPGTCRLRIKNFNPANFAGACPACIASGLPDWKGEFAQFCNLAASEKYAPAAGVSIGGKAFKTPLCIVNNFGVLAGFWVFQLFCDDGGVGAAVWFGTGPATAAGPIGTYTKTGGCLAGPATLDIEGFTP